ncbi:hypothetical protein MAPG_09707 [Magnaporthiopsis poae ATCC 64411]|uniref:Uncharacterized protein n=1 Tax=Magnaporthiopsis poae (strain ATCC 64411 / 73-15) TaxID=644358 RepID=A0A0C4EAN1_MAGP6|nr:hypothetical protein MAPG_09707 [Magnaporthiopsis poae ATCC 64411]
MTALAATDVFGGEQQGRAGQGRAGKAPLDQCVIGWADERTAVLSGSCRIVSFLGNSTNHHRQPLLTPAGGIRGHARDPESQI